MRHIDSVGVVVMPRTVRAQGWREYNPLMLIAVLLLLAISIPMVYSTTIGQSGSFSFQLGAPFTKHLIWIGLGITAFFLLSLLDYRSLRPLTWPGYVIAIGALIAVLATGLVRSGAQSWLGSSTLSFQPTEPAKLALILALAWFWSQREDDQGSWRSLVLSLLILLPMLGLVLLQPDLGSAMVMVGIWIIMALVARTPWYQFVTLGILAAPVVWYTWTHKLQDYQKFRLLVFAMPERCDTDPQFAKHCWQTIQARLAFGNGGMSGMGLNRGIQSQLNYLPVQESDFIFAVTGEELGFIGAAMLIVLQLIVIWQIWRVMSEANDPFGQLIVAGIGGLLLVHCWENMGMNMSIMPMTGIPLPFISYGGSFTLTVLASIGLVQSVSLRQRSWSLGID